MLDRFLVCTLGMYSGEDVSSVRSVPCPSACLLGSKNERHQHQKEVGLFRKKKVPADLKLEVRAVVMIVFII